jgi:hypothetical protein
MLKVKTGAEGLRRIWIPLGAVTLIVATVIALRATDLVNPWQIIGRIAFVLGLAVTILSLFWAVWSMWRLLALSQQPAAQDPEDEEIVWAVHEANQIGGCAIVFVLAFGVVTVLLFFLAF